MLPRECAEETSISLSTVTPSPPERRRQQRHLTILRVGALIIGGERELCLVRNISAGGIMAHIYRSLPVGTPVAIEIKNDAPLTGTVVWVSESNVGIAFDTPIDVPALLASSKLLGDGKRARRPRIQIDRRARVRCEGQVYCVHVSDISQGGVRIETQHGLKIDADTVVTLDGFRALPGIVKWQKDGHCGISFIQVIPIHELCEWLREDSQGSA